MNKYGITLRNLLSFSNTKFIVLGNYLGYDVSYVSKWCSGCKLPTVKSSQEINKKVGILLGKEIIKLDKGLNFFTEFGVEIPKNKLLTKDDSFLGEIIYKLLEEAYNEQAPKNLENDGVDIFFDSSEIKSLLEEIFQKELLGRENQEEIKIYTSMDICMSDCIYIIDLLSKINYENKNITLAIGFSLNESQKDIIKKISVVYGLLNKFVNLNIEIYDSKDFKHLNFIVMKKRVSFIYSLSSNGIIESIILVKEKIKVDKIYNIISKSMNDRNRLLSLTNSYRLRKYGYRAEFYSGSSFNFLLVNGFEFLLPSNILNNIIDYAKENMYSENDIMTIKKLKITWEEMFENASINFFVLKSAIFKYLEDGELLYMNVKYKMSIDERKEHYIHFIESIKKNKNIHFYIIDDEKLEKNIDYKISIFSNKEKLFMKNYVRLNEKKEPFFSIVNNESLIKNIDLCFENLKKSFICKEYSCDEIEYIWHKYENLLFRLMEIN